MENQLIAIRYINQVLKTDNRNAVAFVYWSWNQRNNEISDQKFSNESTLSTILVFRV